MKAIDKNTRKTLKNVAHLTSLPSITLKFDIFLSQHCDLLREKAQLFPFEKMAKIWLPNFFEA
jgi:hypothetical protein